MLIGVDLSDGSEDLIRHAQHLFARTASPLQLVLAHVVCNVDHLLRPYLCAKPGPDLQSELAIEAKARLAELGRICTGPRSTTHREIVLTGEVAGELLTAAERHRCDAIGLGTHAGSTKQAQQRFGSTANRIVRSAHCPVVVFPNRD